MGAVVERYTYDPYGKVQILAADGVTVRTVSAVGNPWTFTGRRLDSETGLMYYRARYDDVELGRFIGRDPIGFKGSKWNLYCYANSNPLCNLDPYGLVCTVAKVSGLPDLKTKESVWSHKLLFWDHLRYASAYANATNLFVIGKAFSSGTWYRIGRPDSGKADDEFTVLFECKCAASKSCLVRAKLYHTGSGNTKDGNVYADVRITGTGTQFQQSVSIGVVAEAGYNMGGGIGIGVGGGGQSGSVSGSGSGAWAVRAQSEFTYECFWSDK